MEGELGTALAPVMKPSFSNPTAQTRLCPPPAPFCAPVALEIRNFQNVPSVSSSLLGDVKPGTTKKEGGKAGALSLLRTQPLPPAPTRPALCKRTFSPHHSPSAARPQGLAQLGAPRREARGGRGASGPAEAGKRKGNCKAVAQHKIQQQSKGQTARNRLAKEREQKCPVPGQPRADHRRGRQKGRKPSPSRLRREKKNLRRA